MKPAFSYYGGKQRLANRIVELIPAHKVYVEPFCGGAAVLFAKPPSGIECINDTDGRITNFFRVLRDNPKRLVRQIKLTPYARRDHREAREPATDPVEQARRWYCEVQQGMLNRPMSGWIASPLTNRAATVLNANGRLVAAAERVALAHIENIDAMRCIKNWDSAGSFFYVDPPYPSTDQGHYKGFSQDDFESLVDRLSSIKGKFILSCYPNKAPPKSWRKVEIKTTSTAVLVPKKNSNKRVECLWMNF